MNSSERTSLYTLYLTSLFDGQLCDVNKQMDMWRPDITKHTLRNVMFLVPQMPHTMDMNPAASPSVVLVPCGAVS